VTDFENPMINRDYSLMPHKESPESKGKKQIRSNGSF
jgi:hypothetical protein